METPSNMVPLGTIAPEFSLIDTRTDEIVKLSELKSDKATMLMFICNHCPYVIHIESVLVELVKEYQQRGVEFIAISANDVENYPQDAPELMKARALEHGYSFPYLYDETQEVAKAYGAACTPDFFIFDGDLHCIYRGQFDDSRPSNDIEVTGEDIRHALDSILTGERVNMEQKPSIGCNIKWKEIRV